MLSLVRIELGEIEPVYITSNGEFAFLHLHSFYIETDPRHFRHSIKSNTLNCLLNNQFYAKL